MTLTSKSFYCYLSLCLIIFLATWYDTTHLHVWTSGLNDWLTHWVREPMQPLTPFQQGYHLLLIGITLLGGNPVFFLCVSAVCARLMQKKAWKALFYTIITVVLAVGLAKVFKTCVYSPRPFPFEIGHESFPSGHVTRSMLWCGIVLCLNKFKVISLPGYVRDAVISIPLLVGFSRIALGHHWFSDVIGAYAMVGTVLLVGCVVYKRVVTQG